MIAAIQAALEENNLDAWLLYDFRGSNPIGRRIVGLGPDRHSTRRFFYLIPRVGAPTAIVHAVEPSILEGMAGACEVYRSHRDLVATLEHALADMKRVAMEYSPGGALPYIGRVDAGTVEMIAALGPSVVSSADLVQIFEARWTEEQKSLHDRAAIGVLSAKDAAFSLVRERLSAANPIFESELQEFLCADIQRRGLVYDYPPIVAVNEHASDPHFETRAGASDRAIRRGDVLLIDAWAKLRESPQAVYYDTTWMAYCGKQAPTKVLDVWETVREARDAAVACVQKAVASQEVIRGCDVDDVARGVIVRRGYGSYFVHRTGHSIGTEVHGNGVNIDNFETHDERRIISGLCFSIEPGVYLPEFGMRSEIDVYVGGNKAEVTGAAQERLLLIS